MADTIPDVRLTRSAYLDLYAITGIPKGTQLMIQNKSSTDVLIQVKNKQPLSTSTDGTLIPTREVYVVEGDNLSTVWALGSGNISVQPQE